MFHLNTLVVDCPLTLIFRLEISTIFLFSLRGELSFPHGKELYRMLRIPDGARTAGLALMITALLMGCFHSPPPKPETRLPGDYAYTKEYIRWFVQQQIKKHDVTGVSLALVDDQRVVWAEGFGYADKAHNLPATPDTLYRAGSITKLFTATAMMQLVERGLIDLDQPITTYLPEFSFKTRFPDAPPITLRHILTHHSGLPRDIARGMWSSTPQPYTTVLDDLTTSYVLHPPNYIFSYSNLGMTVLGQVIERMSGEPYATYVSRAILNPVGMTTALIETKVASSRGQAEITEYSIKDGESFVLTMP